MIGLLRELEVVLFGERQFIAAIVWQARAASEVVM
jgi:hypothetical protein